MSGKSKSGLVIFAVLTVALVAALGVAYWRKQKLKKEKEQGAAEVVAKQQEPQAGSAPATPPSAPLRDETAGAGTLVSPRAQPSATEGTSTKVASVSPVKTASQTEPPPFTSRGGNGRARSGQSLSGGDRFSLGFSLNHLAARSSRSIVSSSSVTAVSRMQQAGAEALAAYTSGLTKSPTQSPSALAEGGIGAYGDFAKSLAALRNGTGAAQRAPFRYATKAPTDDTGYLQPGTLVRCHLINTIDSLMGTTPIVAVVTHNVKALNGEVIIPAGTRVSGYTANVVRDRIMPVNQWRMVFRTGELRGKQLSIVGQCLQAQSTEEQDFFGPDDMRPGLKGEIVRNKSWSEAKLALATAMQAFIATQQSVNTNTVTGTATLANSTENSARAAGAAVVERYSQNLLREIEANSAYVMVMGGEDFYIHIDQTFDPGLAAIAPAVIPEDISPTMLGLPAAPASEMATNPSSSKQ